MNAATLNTHARSNGVYALVVALNGNLGALSRHAGDASYADESVCNLGYLSLEQSLKECGAGAREYDFGVVVLVVDALDDGTHGLALAVHVARNLLRLGEDKLVVLVVYYEHLALPYLVHLTCDDLSHAILVFIIQ